MCTHFISFVNAIMLVILIHGVDKNFKVGIKCK